MDFIASLLPYAILLLVLAAALPGAFLLCRRDGGVPAVLAASVTAGISFGGLSWVMLMLGLIGVPLQPLVILLAYVALMLPGVVIWLREGRPLPKVDIRRSERLSLALVLVVCAAVVFNAVNLPFFRDDALGIYQPQALEIARTQALIPLAGADSLYLTYPMLAQLNTAFVYMIAGWQHDYAAKLVTTLLAVAAVGGACALVIETGRRVGGLLAAVMLVCAPTFVSWAASGYVDLPLGCFLVLTVTFLIRAWETGALMDACAAGLMFGLACWAKNNALIAAPSFVSALVLLVALRRMPVRHALAGGLVVLLAAGPWYARNLVGAGFLLPDTTWTEHAARTLGTLFVFITVPNNFLLTGWLVTLALAVSPLAWVHRRAQAYPELLILVFAGPFFAGWWLFASYDERFLVALLPLLCALAGLLFADALARLWVSRPMRGMALGMATVLALYCAFIAVQYKSELLRDPFMSDTDKRAMVGRPADTSIPPP